MRIVAVALLALTTLTTGCLSLHADIPEDVIRRHAALEDGIELGATCSLEGKSYSEGAVACMEGRLMTCDPAGRWTEGDRC